MPITPIRYAKMHLFDAEGIKPQYAVTSDGRIWLRTKSGRQQVERDAENRVRIFDLENNPLLEDADTIVCFAIHGPCPDPAMVASRDLKTRKPDDPRPETHADFLSWQYPQDSAVEKYGVAPEISRRELVEHLNRCSRGEFSRGTRPPGWEHLTDDQYRNRVNRTLGY